MRVLRGRRIAALLTRRNASMYLKLAVARAVVLAISVGSTNSAQVFAAGAGEDEKAIVESFRGEAATVKTLLAVDERMSTMIATGYFTKKRGSFTSTSFDVKRTDSLVSPYLGVIRGEWAEEMNNPCGTLVEAVQAIIAKKQGCAGGGVFERTELGAGEKSYNFKTAHLFELTYAYQDSGWRLKSFSYSIDWGDQVRDGYKCIRSGTNSDFDGDILGEVCRRLTAKGLTDFR
jgi:hypothetical protein